MSHMTLDDLHGDTPVAFIGITLLRSGVMKMEGSITDEKFVQYMLDTAKDTMRNYHAKQKMGKGSPIIVPPWDTALTGTPEEKKVLAARGEPGELALGGLAHDLYVSRIDGYRMLSYADDAAQYYGADITVRVIGE